jgi:hypothetical protein
LTAEDIETLSNDPPLPFFILFEAMQQAHAEGLCLGILGSIIVADVIFGVLASNPRPFRDGTGSLFDALADLSAAYYQANIFADVPEIQSMDQLVEFVAEIAELRHAVPEFL